MAWLIVLSTIPAGLTGLLLEHQLRTVFAKQLAAAVFLSINGVILLTGEWLRRRALIPAPAEVAQDATQGAPALDVAIATHVSTRDAAVIGVLQTAA